MIYTGTERNLFTNREFVTIYVGSTLHEKTKFRKNVTFDWIVLAFHNVSCFNASSSR